MDRLDVTLIQRLQAGDQQALEFLYDRLAPLVNALLLRLLGNTQEAEEILGETFWQLWHTASSYNPSRGTVEGWVITIARSRALDRLRVRKRQGSAAAAIRQSEAALSPGTASMPEATVLHAERARAVATALQSLSDDQRVPIELAYYEGMSQSEIAARLRAPIGTIKTRIRLGLGRLRKMLEPYLGEDA